MPLKETFKVSDDMVRDEFDVSVRMSTYLVAFSVNDFLFKERKTASGITVRKLLHNFYIKTSGDLFFVISTTRII